jgi:hypothetical protein
MEFFQLLIRVAAVRGGPMTFMLNVGTDYPPLPCRDAEQAALIASLWRTYNTVTEAPGTWRIDIKTLSPENP